jgi:signal transduction histidine kinase
MATIAVAPPDANASVRRGPVAWVVSSLALGGVALAAVSLALALSGDVSGVQFALLEWTSLPYIAAGLVAWSRRPDSRLGPLMIAGGFASGLSALQFAHVDPLFTIGAALDVLPAAVFLHVYLAFPDGRLRSRFERGLVGAAYASAIGLQFVKMSLGTYGTNHLLAISAHPDTAQTVQQIQLVSISAMCIAAIGVLAARRYRSGPPLRRSLALLIDSFALGLVMIAVLYVFGAFDGPAFKEIQRATLTVIGISPIAFLVGLLDAHLARSAVGDLFVALRADPAPTDLRDALARTLRDPSLQLVYWLPKFDTYADLDGRAVDLPDPTGVRVTTTVARRGAQVAALIHDPSLNDEPELLAAVTAAAAIAIENARLHVELRAQLEELAGSRARVIEAGQKERQRLERDLHDGAQQRLIALSLELSLLERKLSDDPDVKRRLDEAQAEITLSLEELRTIARGIHPAVVTGHGLAVALEQVAARAPLPVRLSVETNGRLPEPIEVATYYVVTESLANVAKHARATTSSVDVTRTSTGLVVEIVDDGVGGADSERGSGLRGLADRVEALGGRLRVWTPRGGGTRVKAEIPCA